MERLDLCHAEIKVNSSRKSGRILAKATADGYCKGCNLSPLEVIRRGQTIEAAERLAIDEIGRKIAPHCRVLWAQLGPEFEEKISQKKFRLPIDKKPVPNRSPKASR